MQTHVLAGALALAAPTLALAAAVDRYSYELSIDGGGAYGFNAPRVSLVNHGGARITHVSVGIGDLRYHFDAWVDAAATGGLSAVVLAPDTVNGGVRSDVFEVSFDGFDAGEGWSAALDIDWDLFDPSLPGSMADARRVLFRAGEASEVAVTFEDGYVLRGALPAEWGVVLSATSSAEGGLGEVTWVREGSFYRMSQRVVPVPLPVAAVSGLALLASVVVPRRWRPPEA